MNEPLTIPDPPRDRPLLLFDGDCAFCRYWLARWRRFLDGRLDAEPSQTAASRFPTLPAERYRRSVQLVMTDGAVYEGAEAAFRAFALAPGNGHWLRVYQRVPGARAVTEGAYRFAAAHRNGLFRVTRWIWGKEPS